MDRQMILYRGSLKSCNYHCSYCPFSKHRISERELIKDQEQWEHFIQTFETHIDVLNFRALMVVPYGEALIHPWYWEGLGRLSASKKIDAVGAQTNFSFPIEKSLAWYVEAGGILQKLRLWTTFHPEMTTIAEFVERCRQVYKTGALLSVGVVGVPENLELMQELRKELPKDIYLWINQMDGLRRDYTKEEKEAFLKIDPYFEREFLQIPADVTKCQNRLFVEGNGKLRACNICKEFEYNWDELCERATNQDIECSRKLCSCYLAYGGRNDFMNQILFGPYPLFRIPRRPKAVFLDIEGTLISTSGEPKSCLHDLDECEGHISYRLQICKLEAEFKALVREKASLFFATTLPYKDAIKRCKSICHMFAGGVFAGGAHIVLEQRDKIKEHFYYLEDSCLNGLDMLQEKFSYRILTCQNEGQIYKITLLRAKHRPWSQKEAKELSEVLPVIQSGKARYFVEDNCLQIVDVKATKEEGVRMLCEWLDILPKEAAAAGDSEEDVGMMKLTY